MSKGIVGEELKAVKLKKKQKRITKEFFHQVQPILKKFFKEKY